MPDSFLPPSGGPGSFDERDLDAVLSGDTADVPPALRPVADTLAALRGAPTPGELGGEAAVMAEFRAAAGRPAGPAQTLILPARPDGRPARRRARHRARRRAVPSVSRRAGALMGVAAAVLIGVVVVSGNLPGPIARVTHIGHTSSASPSATPSSGGNPQNTRATPTKAPTTPDTTPARSQVVPSSTPSPSPEKLCQEYFDGHYYTHPKSQANWSLYTQLAKLARSFAPGQVAHYCSQYPGIVHHLEAPSNGSERPGKAPENAAKANPSPAASSAPTEQGAAGSGSGNGNSGPGQGNQGGGGPTPNP